MKQRLPRSFFEDYTPRVAERLLGNLLVRRLRGETLSGKIVEVEAYRGEEDPASHAYGGTTARNLVMFGEAGHAYVYFTYGVHHCLNITTEKKGQAGAILIRALQPVDGLEGMRRNSGKEELLDLMSGPGKLTQALRINRKLNGEDMITSQQLYVTKGTGDRVAVKASSRIGITLGYNFQWRFFIDGNPFVSRTKLRSPEPITTDFEEGENLGSSARPSR